MLRISIKSRNEQEVVLKLEGRLSDEDVGLLEREGGRWLQQSDRLVLDMEGVQLVDRAAIALLKDWAKEGLALCGGTLFVRELLKSHGLPMSEGCSETDAAACVAPGGAAPP